MAGGNDHLASFWGISCAIRPCAIGLINGVGIAYLKINPMVIMNASATIVLGAGSPVHERRAEGGVSPLLSAIATERLAEVCAVRADARRLCCSSSCSSSI